jgi:cell division protein FtsI (penicillin-binding protein 3)/stage V sporulation protein D (sporulation-specific penicillin-binding protein)
VPYRGQERPAHDGSDVTLTIDMGIQNIVENELDEAVKKYKPRGGAIAIMMRPQTGEILALANRPNFDLNDFAHAKPDGMRNRAIINMVEPGSTFKIVTTSASLNESLEKLDSVIFCENGSFLYAGHRLHDDHHFGDLTVEEILAKSSNIGAAKLALQLGDQRLYEYIKRYGFGERTGINLPGEIAGIIHPPSHWSKLDITRIPMGQSVGVTPLQIATAMCVIANGGRLMMPQIIHQVCDEDGNVVKDYPPVEVRRVVSEQTAAQIRQALTKVVAKGGTAPLAQVPGFTTGGKTGTAQRTMPGIKGYARGKYVTSFIGFMPVDHPAFVCLVMVDDAQVGPDMNYGGQVAAPVFRQIAEKTASYLNLVPDPGLLTQNLTQVQGDRD